MKIGILFLSVFPVLWLPPPGVADVYVYKDKQGTYVHQRSDPSGLSARYTRGQCVLESDWPLYEGLIRSASNRHNVDAALIWAVIKVESDFDSSARSHKGATGLMQLMPETARLHNVADLFDPGANIEGGVRHLKLLLGKYQGDLELSLAAYNAGIKAVEKHGGIPPFAETRDYVRRVLGYYQTYRGDSLQVMQ